MKRGLRSARMIHTKNGLDPARLIEELKSIRLGFDSIDAPII